MNCWSGFEKLGISSKIILCFSLGVSLNHPSLFKYQSCAPPCYWVEGTCWKICLKCIFQRKFDLSEHFCSQFQAKWILSLWLLCMYINYTYINTGIRRIVGRSKRRRKLKKILRSQNSDLIETYASHIF